jgi:hypothetical protein
MCRAEAQRYSDGESPCGWAARHRIKTEFESTDSASDKALHLYRLLVHDKLIASMPKDQVAEKTIRHRLATWYVHQLPEDHPLLK